MKIDRIIALSLASLAIAGCATTIQPVDGNPQFAFQLLSTTTTRGLARDVWVDGTTAYVADDEYGITIWDVSNLNDPVMIDSIETYGRVQDIAYSPEIGMVFSLQSSTTGGITTFNRTTKGEQIKIGNGISRAFRFKVLSPDSLIVAETEPDNDGCQFLFSVRDATQLIEWPSDPTSFYTPDFGHLNSLELDSNYVFFAHSQYGVSIIQYDYTRIGPGFRDHVIKLGRVDTPGMARDLVLSRDRRHLFVADNQSGLQVIDVTDKTHPRLVGSSSPQNANDVYKVRAVGDTAIFVEQLRGIYAIDCSVPTSPRYFGIYTTPDPQGLFIRESDNTIFLTDLDLGLLILKFRS